MSGFCTPHPPPSTSLAEGSVGGGELQLQAWPAWGVRVPTAQPLCGLQSHLVVMHFPLLGCAIREFSVMRMPWTVFSSGSGLGFENAPCTDCPLEGGLSLPCLLPPVQGPLGPVVSPVLTSALPGVTHSKPSAQMLRVLRFISNPDLSSKLQTPASSRFPDLPLMSYRHVQPVSKPGSIWRTVFTSSWDSLNGISRFPSGSPFKPSPTWQPLGSLKHGGRDRPLLSLTPPQGSSLLVGQGPL